MKKICVVITARPSYSRMRSALFALMNEPGVELQVVVTASAVLELYGKVVNEIKKDGLPVVATVYSMVSGETLETSAKTTGLGIVELSSVFQRLDPDVVVTVADRFETMATAIAAAYMNIPLVHIQGGEVTGNIDEKVRHAVTKLSDLHLVSTDKARERVIQMGEHPDKVIKTGCPSLDIARHVKATRNTLDFDPAGKYPGVGSLLADRTTYAIIMQHPVTTEIEMAQDQADVLLHCAVEMEAQVYWFWPNIDAGSDEVSKAIRRFRENKKPQSIYFIKNMSPEDFLVLANGASCMIGNSSVALRECSYLGVPAINIGSRQSGRERGGNVLDAGFSEQHILEAYHRILSQPRPKMEYLYGDGYAGKRIARCICDTELTVDKKLCY